MRIITFSGWGQRADSLAPLMAEGDDATYIHYQHFDGVKELFPFVKGKACDVLIGWSLGGQLAIRAVLEGYLAPKMLVLIATPFQFLASVEHPSGMDKGMFNLFEQDFYNEPEKTLRKFTLLMNKGDAKAESLNKTMLSSPPSIENWLVWLRELKHFSCADAALSALPRTVIVQGTKDKVVHMEQAETLHSHIPGSHLTVVEDAGHAVHKHAPHMIQHLIRREYQEVTNAAYA